MQKKSIISILIIVLLLIVVGFIISTEYLNQEKEVNTTHATFKLPKGYHSEGLNGHGDLIITNGTDTFFIAEYEDNNMQNHINIYLNDRNQNNQTINMSNLTVDGKFVSKSINLASGSTHYWFIKDNHVYSIYTWNKNEKIDSIFVNLIDEMN